MGTAALGPPTRYNVAVLGPGAGTHSSALQKTMRLRLTDLSPDLADAVAFLGGAQTLIRDPKVPVVGVYFGDSSPSDEDLSAVTALITAAAVMIPVVSDLDRYKSSVPPALAGVNGSSLSGDPALDTIANLVLENLGLLRRTRRLFISYHRVEAAREALQLRHELDSRGYDVFLDTHSVPKGDNFQEVLWQRLADSDVAVLLDTPDFMVSRWTREELAQAEAMTVGLLQLIWPGQTPVPYSVLCEPFHLTQDDFDKAKGGLGEDTLVRIGLAVEKLRARSLSARHNNLVREFCDAAASVGVTATVQPERFISAQVSSGSLIAIPAVGVPDALRYHEASRRFLTPGGAPVKVLLIYDQRGLRPNWEEFLDWLDDFLPVKAMRITTVARRLPGV